MLFLDKRPIGWREDYRTALIMQSFGVKEKPEKIFSSLARIAEDSRNKEGNTANLKNSAFFMKLMNAKGGDKLKW